MSRLPLQSYWSEKKKKSDSKPCFVLFFKQGMKKKTSVKKGGNVKSEHHALLCV